MGCLEMISRITKEQVRNFLFFSEPKNQKQHSNNIPGGIFMYMCVIILYFSKIHWVDFQVIFLPNLKIYESSDDIAMFSEHDWGGGTIYCHWSST